MELLPLAVMLLALPVVLWLFATQTRRVAGRLRKDHPKLFEGAVELGQCGCLSDADLERPNGMQAALRGVLLQRRGQVVFVGAAVADGLPREIEWPRQTTVLTFEPADPLVLGVPDLIKLAGPQAMHFLFVQELTVQVSRRQLRAMHESLRSLLGGAAAPGPRTASPMVTLALLPVLVAVGLLLYSTWQAGIEYGPRSIAVDGGAVAVATKDELLRLDGSGALREAATWEQLGITDGISGMIFDIDGSLLAVDHAEGVLKRCVAGGKPCLMHPAFADPALHLKHAVGLALDRTRGDLYVADTARHRILRIGRDGQVRQTSRAAGKELCFPNDGAVSREGHVVWPDTNNFRVLEWSNAETWPEPDPVPWLVVAATPGQYGCVVRDRSGEHSDPFVDRMRDYRITGRPVPLANLGHGSAWVSSITQAADGRWWAVFSGDNMRGGDVAILSAGWQIQRVIQLPERADPWGIALLNGDALLPDARGGLVHRIGSNGDYLGEFGNEDVQRHFAGPGGGRKHWLLVRITTLACLGVGVVLALLLALRYRKKWIRVLIARA